MTFFGRAAEVRKQEPAPARGRAVTQKRSRRRGVGELSDGQLQLRKDLRPGTLTLDAVVDEKTGKKGIGLQGASNGMPVVKRLLRQVDQQEHFRAGETPGQIVIGFVARLLKLLKCGGDIHECGLNGSPIQGRSEFGRVSGCSELLGKSLHRGVAKRTRDDRAEWSPAMAGEHKPGRLLDEEVEKRAVGGGNGPSQAGLRRALGFSAGEETGLFEKIGV